MPASKRCKDCLREGVRTHRKADKPGPRCATHDRQKRAQTRDAAWERRLWDIYRLTSEQYWAIYDAQGGRCAICQRATGASKKLAVDHDHSCCSGSTSCGLCVRSLLCSPCNRMLGHLRDDPEMVERILFYLDSPPGRDVLDQWNAP